MGITVRTETERFTQWWPWDGHRLSIDWSRVPEGEELYAHRNDTSFGPSLFDDWETINVVDDPKFSAVLAQLRTELRTQFFRHISSS